MENPTPFTVHQSLRTRLVTLLIGLTVVAVVSTAYLGINATQQAGQRAQSASRDTLRQQAEEFLVQITEENAEKRNLLFADVRQDAHNTALYTTNLFEQPDAFASRSYWDAETAMRRGPGGQYINSAQDVTTVFVPSVIEVDDRLIQRLELSAFLDFIFVPIYDSDPNTVAIYIIGKEEYSRLYPNIELGLIVPPDFLATEDIFYASAAPQNNPEREVVWTAVYEDPAGQGLLVTAVAPIYVGDEFLGVIGIDVSLANLTANIEAASPIAGGYAFLVDQEGRALALPAEGYQDILGRDPNPDEVGADLRAELDDGSPFGAVIDQIARQETGFRSVTVDGQELFVAYTPLEETGWGLATVVEADNMLQAASTLQQELEDSTQTLITTRILPFGAVVLLLAAVVGFTLANRLVVPLRKLADAAQRIGAGEWDTPLPEAGNDEIGVLTRVFQQMTHRLRELVEGLEQRVAQRTRDLRVAGDVSRQITTVLDIDQLLQEVVRLTVPGFNLYGANVFLWDEDEQVLRLAAGIDDTGRDLKTLGFPALSLETRPSLVAMAARRRTVVSEDDVTAAGDYMQSDVLPETRSELAIPIVLGDRLLGVFDLQSRAVGHFGEVEQRVLTSLAEQVAVAVRNAQLYTEAHQAREEAEEANRVKSQFLANMSHELRTPLNAIINFTGFVADGVLGPVNDQQTLHLNRALDSSQHLLNLINDILDLTKIEVGMMELFMQEVDLNAALNSTIATAQGLVKDKPVDIQTEVEDGLPVMTGDRRRIRQVLLNLVSNAVKFTPKGTITLKAHHHDGEIHIAVADTGIGIAPEDQEVVFETFGRAKHNLDAVSSTGLGLPISKYFVEAHGGRIWLESEKGKGSVFHVTLPVERTPQPHRTSPSGS